MNLRAQYTSLIQRLLPKRWHAYLLAFEAAKERIKALESSLQASELRGNRHYASRQEALDQVARLEREVSHLRHETSRLYELATVDRLTQLFNRVGFEQHFAAAVSLLSSGPARSRDGGEEHRHAPHLSMLVFDIDRFKVINDTFGHSAGDAALVTLADTLRRHPFRPGDFTARFGGDEFFIVLPYADIANAERIALEIMATIRETPFNIPVAESVWGTVYPVRISIGVSSTEISPRDDWQVISKQLFQEADRALYAAKTQGRNRVVRYDHIIHQLPKV